MYTLRPVPMGAISILQEVYFLMSIQKVYFWLYFMCTKSVYYLLNVVLMRYTFCILMFQITTKSIHQIYTKYTQCSILHVYIEYTKSIVHFVKGQQRSTLSENTWVAVDIGYEKPWKGLIIKTG